MSIANIVAIITAISALISALAAAIWGHGLATAKDEIIKAKDAQLDAFRSNQEQILKAKETQIDTLKQEIDSYRELTPIKIREYFVSTKVQLEEYIEKLKDDLHKAEYVIEAKNEEIKNYELAGEEKATEIELLKIEFEELKQQHRSLNEKLAQGIQDLEGGKLGIILLERMKEARRRQAEEMAKMKICPDCGESNDSDAKFCEYCGKLLPEESKVSD